jgi:NADP-dependent 3-hydroxy acid dehydrogenase YdfG
MTDLSNRTAVVTGASSGIGAAIASGLADAGARVALVGRRRDRLEQLAGALPAAVAVPADLTERAPLTDRVHDALGPVDLVVACAGVMLGAPFEAADTGEWDRMVDVNVRALLDTGRAFADDLLAAAAEGRAADLVHIGSIGSHVPFPNYAVDCATKAAVAQLTRSLRQELGPRGVRVKNVEPGLTDTELGADMRDPVGRQMLEQLRATVPPLDPADVATAVVSAVAAPPSVNLAEIVIVPTAQP